MARTALELINALRRKIQFPSVTDLSDPLSISLLDVLNTAISDMFQLDWDFLHRKGQIVTEEVAEGEGWCYCSNGSADSILWPYYIPFGPYPIRVPGMRIDRLIVTGSEDHREYQNTAMIIDRFLCGFASLAMTLREVWPGIDHTIGVGKVPMDTLADAKVVSYEFILPSTVKAVTEVRHQKRKLDLVFMERDDFEENYIRGELRISDHPQIAVVSSWGRSSGVRVSGSENYQEGLVLQIWPIPKSSFLIDYSYLYDQPALVSETDEISIRHDKMENLILDLALSYILQSGIGTMDSTNGLTLEKIAWRRARRANGSMLNV